MKIQTIRLSNIKIQQWSLYAFILGWPLFLVLRAIGENFTYYFIAAVMLLIMIYLLIKAPIFDIISYMFVICFICFIGLNTYPIIILPVLLMIYTNLLSKYHPTIKSHLTQKHPEKVDVIIKETGDGEIGYTDTLPQSSFFYAVVCFFWLLLVLLFGGCLIMSIYQKNPISILIFFPFFGGSCYGFWFYLKKMIA